MFRRHRFGLLGALLAVAVLLAAPSMPAHSAPGGPTAPASSPVNDRPGSAFPELGRLTPGATPVPTWTAGPDVRGAGLSASAVRNVLVDIPCNGSSNAEVEQAYDPSVDYLYEAWIGCGGIGFSRSVDGGYSFQPAFLVPGSAPYGGSSWDPAIALSPNGTVYLSFMVSVPGDTPVVAWSWNHGQSFAGYSDVFTPPANSFGDRDFLAIAPNGTLYVTWDYSPMYSWANGSPLDVLGCAPGGSCYFTNGDYNIVIAWSSDGGTTWSSFVPVDPEYPWGGAPCGPLLVAPNGAIDVLFEDYNITGASHALGLGYNYFTRSTDGGVLWSTPVALSDYSFPNDVWWIDGAITEDRSGSLYATYDSVNATADTAWVAISRDGGTTWTPSIQVNPDTNAAAHNLVEGAGGENGTVYVAWMTNASGSEVTDEAPLSGNGTTWGPVVQVSDQPGLAGLWIGDTLGISYVGGGRVAVSWSYGVYQAGFAGSQVFAAVLNETAPGAPSITGVTPGTADLQVDWAQPSGASPVAGYLVAWGFEGGNESNATVGPTNRSFVVHGLMAFADYHVNVSAFNAAGTGPPSPSVRFTLQPWTRVSGTVAPISASVWLDSAPESVADGVYTVLTSYTTHLVTVSAMNYGTQAKAALPAWNATSWLNFTLTLLPGTLKGFVVPVTSNVSWNGTVEGVLGNGYFAFSVAPGATGTLAVAYPGLIGVNRSLTVPANQTLWENVTLVAPNATLDVQLDPAGAELFVDGARVTTGDRGNASISLVGGKHPIEATANGYYAYFANLTLIPGTIDHVPVNLTAISVPPDGNVSSRAPSPFSDPVVLALLAGVAVLAVVIVLLGRRGRVDPPPPRAPEGTYGADPGEPVEETEGVELPTGDHAGPSA